MKYQCFNISASKKTGTGHITAVAILMALIVILAALACAPAATHSSPQPSPPPTSPSAPTDTIITPADSPNLPPRGFYTGLLPTPAAGQSSPTLTRKHQNMPILSRSGVDRRRSTTCLRTCRETGGTPSSNSTLVEMVCSPSSTCRSSVLA
jgi:hypothetical protein